MKYFAHNWGVKKDSFPHIYQYSVSLIQDLTLSLSCNPGGNWGQNKQMRQRPSRKLRAETSIIGTEITDGKTCFFRM